MHVDGNNHDFSRVIALGKYTGDEVCFADETDGTMGIEGIELMRGLLHLKVGSKIMTAKDDVRMALLQHRTKQLRGESETIGGHHNERRIIAAT